MQAHPQDFGHKLPPTDSRVVLQQRLVDKLTDDLRRLTELQAVRSTSWQTASGALAAVETWLRHGVPGNTVLQEYDGPEPKLLKGEDVLSGIERLRRRGRELRADAHRVASSQFPANYTKAKMRRQISQLAEQGEPSVSSLVELDGNVEFPTMRQQATVVGAQERSLAFSEQPDMIAVMCWMFHDELVRRLDAEIDAETDGSALSHEQRELRTAEIMGDLLSTERDEAELTWCAMEERLPVEFRPDINPCAVLGLKMVTVTNGHTPKQRECTLSTLCGDEHRDARSAHQASRPTQPRRFLSRWPSCQGGVAFGYVCHLTRVYAKGNAHGQHLTHR